MNYIFLEIDLFGCNVRCNLRDFNDILSTNMYRVVFQESIFCISPAYNSLQMSATGDGITDAWFFDQRSSMNAQLQGPIRKRFQFLIIIHFKPLILVRFCLWNECANQTNGRLWQRLTPRLYARLWQRLYQSKLIGVNVNLMILQFLQHFGHSGPLSWEKQQTFCNRAVLQDLYIGTRL